MKLVLLSSFILILSGCSTKSNTMDKFAAEHEAIKSNLQYDIIGEVTGEASGTTILGVNIETFKDQTKGSIDGDMGSFLSFDMVKSTAVYNAIKKIPEAHAVMSPRWEIETTGFPLLYEVKTVKVKAIAIKYRSITK